MKSVHWSSSKNCLPKNSTLQIAIFSRETNFERKIFNSVMGIFPFHETSHEAHNSCCTIVGRLYNKYVLRHRGSGTAFESPIQPPFYILLHLSSIFLYFWTKNNQIISTKFVRFFDILTTILKTSSLRTWSKSLFFDRIWKTIEKNVFSKSWKNLMKNF